ncbi:MAG: hypothetical protein HDQ95_07810 [Roseburia sp.]|nr:hypothetical protein [Roseburia sp.]
MKKEELYTLLTENNIYSKIDAETTKVFENDILIEDCNLNKRFKIETNDLSNDDIIIALLAKQTLYIKTIKNVIVGSITIFIICCILMFFIANA